MLKASRGTIGMLAQQAKDGECIVQRCRCGHLWAAELVTAAIEESDALRCRKAIASLDRAQDASIRRARRETGRHLPSSRPSGGVRGGCLTGSLCGLIAICGIRGSCGVTFLGRSASFCGTPPVPFFATSSRCSAPTDSRTFQSISTHARIEAFDPPRGVVVDMAVHCSRPVCSRQQRRGAPASILDGSCRNA